MPLLALDPSSAVIGYAVFDAGKVVEAGRLTPVKKSAPSDERIDSLIPQLAILLGECKPSVCVIEQPAFARPGRNVKIASLLHRVFGEVRRACISSGAKVEYVYVSTWKGNRSKASEMRLAAATLPGYANDAGGDVADAVGLGRYWLQLAKTN